MFLSFTDNERSHKTNHKAASHLIVSPNSRALNAWAVLASRLHRAELKWQFFWCCSNHRHRDAEYESPRNINAETDKEYTEILAV